MCDVIMLFSYRYKMDSTNDLTKRLTSGCFVKITTEEGDFEGVFGNIEEGSNGKEIQLLNCVHMGRQLSAIQSKFALSDIETLVPNSKVSNNISRVTCETDVTPSGNGINGQSNNSILPKNKPKSKNKDRPVICKVRKKNIADISHLNNLHLLRLPELLDQVQIEDSMQLLPSDNVPGAFVIPKPDQDSDHMEGDKYKNRHSLEFTSVRNQTWKDTSVPPNIHVPELLFIIQHENDCIFTKAVDQLRKMRTIAVSLEGQFLGRHGKLSLITFATPEIVYVFDVVSIGSHCFDLGLREILEDCDIQKGNS